MTAVALRADRTSPRWQRLRAACQHSAKGVNLDEHCDFVWLVVEAFTNTTGTGRTPTKRCAAGARQDGS